MKLNRLKGLILGLMLSLPVVGHQALAAGANDALPGRLAELRIYDRTEGHHLPVYWHRGKAYVVGNPGNEYEISLANQVSGDLLAVISVDGVNVLTGQTASSQQSGYIFKGGESYGILGWRKSQERVAAFYFTSLSNSYAGRTGRPGNVGVIGVALFQRKPVAVAPRAHVYGSKPDARYSPHPAAPASEADLARGMPQASPSMRQAESIAQPQQPERLGTGHGRIEDSPVHFEEFVRATRRPTEVLSIHYDSYANLVARGVIPANYGMSCRGTMRHAGCSQAFPGDPQAGFVPDPPR